MKLNKLASIGVLMIILAQISALAFATIELTGYYSFNYIEIPEKWLIPLTWVLIPLSSISIVTTLIAMFKVNTDMKALSAWLAIISIAVIWYPYFFPAIFAFIGAILMLAGKYQPVSTGY